LTPESADEIDCIWRIADKESVLRGVLSAGLTTLAIRNSGEEKVRAAVDGAISHYRQPDGSYRFKNKFRYVISKANHTN
jgi:hypothetical protein